MKQLFIEQFTTTGEKKVWKLGADKRQYTFGTSRTADLISIDSSLELWEGVFQYENGTKAYYDIKTIKDAKDVFDGTKSTIISAIAQIEKQNKNFSNIFGKARVIVDGRNRGLTYIQAEKALKEIITHPKYLRYSYKDMLDEVIILVADGTGIFKYSSKL